MKRGHLALAAVAIRKALYKDFTTRFNPYSQVSFPTLAFSIRFIEIYLVTWDNHVWLLQEFKGIFTRLKP